jgi:phosphate transport system permease protein
VKFADRAAKALITMGGLGTIAAVSLVCVFLVWVVVPLFLPTSLAPLPGAQREAAKARSVRTMVDEYRVMAWSLDEAGALHSFRVDTGESLEDVAMFAADARPSAWGLSPTDGSIACGFEDGSVRLGSIRFKSSFIEGEEPDALRNLVSGERRAWNGGMVERTVEGQLREQRIEAVMGEPTTLGGDRVMLIDRVDRTQGPMLVALGADGTLRVKDVVQRKNLMTGKVTTTLSGGDVAVPTPSGAGAPVSVAILGVGTSAMVIWEDGRFVRLDTRNVDNLSVAEEGDLVLDPSRKVTAVTQLIGKSTIIVGDSTGEVRTHFLVKPDGAPTADGAVLVSAATFPGSGQAVAALATSARSRMLAIAYADGNIRLHHVTSQRLLGEGRTSDGTAPFTLTLTPKDDGILAVSAGGLSRWDIDAPHPETNAAAIFTPIWYEGSPKPEHTWQSSSGTDDFEPKFGLWPLVFGTLKATLYSMMFAVPLALLAAIYTSEFLSPVLRSRIKPIIELMASLPSVVLGFLAALIFAPIVEQIVPATLAAFATVPLALLLGAYLWQMLPRDTAARIAPYRLLGMLLALPVGLVGAYFAGGIAESWLFAGDIKAWLDGQIGDATGGWMLTFLPISAILVALAVAKWLNPWLDERQSHAPRAVLARTDLLKFAAGVAVTLALAWFASSTVAATGADARGLYVDTYIQRNALIVGFVMGFAVIPIIYTLAEDALTAVPEHLRAASLAVGATRWQTAMQIIVPTAMSGLFSACMIGLGRAVGETMVVLMAAGNTPVMEWNIFNGFRTLSANIAVELPEAVQGGTTYRLLFLAALTLFAMTFVLNTLAELVRQRFRKRAFQL